MLTLLVVWAMCARYTASVSLRQSSPTDIHEGWSHSVNIPQVENFISKGLAESSTSVMVTEAIVLAAENLDGYFVQKTYSDSTCNVWNVARSMPLNYCTTITSSNYSRMSATSNAAITVSFYSDSKCVTTPKSSKIIALGGCSGNYRAEYSSTSAPQSTRPFAKLT